MTLPDSTLISAGLVAAGGVLGYSICRKLADRTRPPAPPADSLSLRDSAATLQALLETASQGVVVTDHLGRIRLVNAATEQIFGYTRAELLEQTVEVLLPLASRQAHVAQRDRFFANPHSRPMGIGMALSARRKSGENFPVEISLSYLGQGDSRLALALVTDITERQRIEENMRESAKVESLGVLAAGIAHDCNNHLTSILGNTSLALEMAGQDESLQNVLDAVLQSGERVALLVRQLLAYSGKGRYSVGPVDLSLLVEETLEMLQNSLPDAVRLEVSLGSSLPPIEADKAQLQQATVNLVLNGVEAIGDRPGVVAVRTGLLHIDHANGHGVGPGDYLELEVRDTGCGMDEETRARMFDPFFSRKFPGRGLGLAATKGIVRAHKGAIQVETRVGKGTRVCVLLPVQVKPSPGRLPLPGRAPGSPAPGSETSAPSW